LKAAWDGVKRMTGLHKTQNKPVHIPMYKSDSDLSEALNTFFSRFDIHDFSDEHKKLTEEQALVKSTLFSITQEDDRSVFKRNKVNKSPGPDGITGRLLKCCSEQLCGVFTDIFEMSLEQRRVPKAWKESIIVPVAKSNTTKSLNDFRPVALTSLVMKSFEKIVKCLLLLRVGEALDPRQFAYRARRGVEDAQITLLNLLYSHLDGPGTHARLLFLDFSSAFNTIQPHVLVSKLLSEFNLESNLVSWIMDFLTNRTQRVKVNGCLSERRVSSTGSPQGCVLSPLLYILYTNDWFTA
jgi:hypothetical protein